MKDIRWHQRFENFEKSFLLLQQTINIEHMSVVERGGMVQFFEMTFELSWKVLKDYLEAEEAMVVKSPKETLKTAIQFELIGNVYAWMDALSDRNLTTHTYDEDLASEVEYKIRTTYYPMLEELYLFLKSKM